MNLETVRRSEQCDLAIWVAIDNVEVVRHIASQDGNVATVGIAENPERSLNSCSSSINADKGKPCLDEDAINLATDAT